MNYLLMNTDHLVQMDAVAVDIVGSLHTTIPSTTFSLKSSAVDE